MDTIIIREKSGKHSAKIIASIITMSIIALLIMAGPANAFTVSLSKFDVSSTEKGNIVSTTASIKIRTDERMPLPNLAGLYIDDKEFCEFNVEASNVTCDDGANVTLINSSKSYGSSYGYGYGYDYKENYGNHTGYSNSNFTYNISLDTSKFTLGEHKVEVKIDVGGNKIYNSGNQTITIANETETNSSVVSGADTEFLGGDVVINLNGTGDVKVTAYDDQPNSTSTFSLPELRKWIEINSSLTNVAGTIIKIYYTHAELAAAGVEESKLRLYFYNATSRNWESPINSGVNMSGDYVWAETDHFSVWGVFEVSAPAVQSQSFATEGGAMSSSKPSETPEISAPQPAETKTPAETNASPSAQKEGLLSRITGAVIGALGKTGTTVAIIVIALIAGTAIAMPLVRKSIRKSIKAKSGKKESRKKSRKKKK